MPDNVKPSTDVNELGAQLRYLQTIYLRQYEMLENEIATYTLAVNSVQKNMQLLNNMEKVKNSKILISGEGGTYLEAEVKNVSKTLAYVGAGYLVEKNLEDSRAFLKENEAKQQAVMKKLTSEKERLEKELVDINFKLASLQQQH